MNEGGKIPAERELTSKLHNILTDNNIAGMSVAITVTAITILRLCEEGILNLDTPVKTYIPQLDRMLLNDVKVDTV